MPVINVSWEDINSYLKWISGKSGKIYRLPSEVEWEYGAQGGGGVEQSMQIPGTASPQSCIGCGGRWDGKQPAPVGSFSPNLAGLYDMLGNVSEWVADCWNDSPISLSLGAAKRETGDCTRRVIKGGSWFLDASQARSSYRSKMSGRSRSATIGFRIIREE
jgi:formylglycine-generating enzyme required for sulfatase activity